MHVMKVSTFVKSTGHNPSMYEYISRRLYYLVYITIKKVFIIRLYIDLV